MDKYRCKLCYKRFANGRAMGGHMRSHMVNLLVPPKPEQEPQQQQQQQQRQLLLPSGNCQFGEEADSASSSSSEEEENEEKLLGYELRENPKKSIRLVDREFSFPESGVLIQDRESETESSKNPIRRRSKRIRRSGISNYNHHHQFHSRNLKQPDMKKPKSGKTESEPEPVSSISDTTSDEHVAYCLIMLSRDKWMREKEVEEEAEPETEDETEDSGELNKSSVKVRGVRGKYKCETCFKVFRSYQALGGHRASHKKIRAINNNDFQTHERLPTDTRNAGVDEEKIHECPVCFRVFSSGQALGGHKRSHGIGSATASTTPAKPPLKSGEPLIDLNLPAPVDDDYEDEISQIELSAVSDAEFVNPIRK